MSPADSMAHAVKVAKRNTALEALILGRKEIRILKSNTQPCAPPDYDPKRREFCGVPIRRVAEKSRFAFVLVVEAM